MEGCVDLRALLVDELEVSVEQVQVVASCRVYSELNVANLILNMLTNVTHLTLHSDAVSAEHNDQY